MSAAPDTRSNGDDARSEGSLAPTGPTANITTGCTATNFRVSEVFIFLLVLTGAGTVVNCDINANRAAIVQQFNMRQPPLCGEVTYNNTWIISSVCVARCASRSCSFAFDTVHVTASGNLTIDPTQTSTRITARIFRVDGTLLAGTATAPFVSNFEIVLTGNSTDQDDPDIQKLIVGHGYHELPYSKVLLAGKGSTISLHGKPKASWVKLARTAEAGSSALELAAYPAGWEVGDTLLVPTTGMLLREENEEVTLVGITETEQGARITIEEQLEYTHHGHSGDLRLNGEVALLTHNIRIMGDNSDSEHELCEASMEHVNFLSEQHSQLLRNQCYGAHTAILEGSTAQFSNVEFKRVGQATRIARYPVHWHLANDAGSAGSYVAFSSIWQSYQRCVTIHGTWGAVVEENVCYGVYGHAFYLEDAIEHANRFERNLAVQVRRGPMVCTDGAGGAGPSAFWITNPNNTYIDNLAVDVGDGTSGMGFWIISGGDIEHEDGPHYLYNPDFWTNDYQSKHAGEIFEPSRSALASSVPNWMLRQQQARTPLKEFRGNGVRSSFRGMHIDGFITSSVPGEIGTAPHDPEAAPIFEQRQPDGTCNYFPKANYSFSGAEGVRVYAPVNFDYTASGVPGNYTAAWSIIDSMHISRCYDTWWSRAARLNITNGIFAWNWIGMTNENSGDWVCPGTGAGPGDTEPRSPGLVNHVVNSLFIGHGDELTNKLLCENGASAMQGLESPAGIRQYDGAFWLSGSRWVNMSTRACPVTNTSGPQPSTGIKSLPYALVAGRQTSCNEKWPIHLYNSWPLGASVADANGTWGWAVTNDTAQNLAQFTGTASCSEGPAGGVVDMTGSLDPEHPFTPRTAYLAFQTVLVQNGELARNTTSEVSAYHYAVVNTTTSARVVSMAWAHQEIENADFNHVCAYCFYNDLMGRGCRKPVQ